MNTCVVGELEGLDEDFSMKKKKKKKKPIDMESVGTAIEVRLCCTIAVRRQSRNAF